MGNPLAMPCRLELLKLQDQTLEAKLAQKREEEQEDAGWSAQPDYAHFVDRSMPWTVPSQLLTVEEEVSTVLLGALTFLEPQSCCEKEHGDSRLLALKTRLLSGPWTVPLQLLVAAKEVTLLVKISMMHLRSAEGWGASDS